MELYREFFSIIKSLNEAGLAYSVVGGIALAFHAQPRFSRDIHILAKPADLPPSARVLMRVATKYPEHVLECAEDSAPYNQK